MNWGASSPWPRISGRACGAVEVGEAVVVCDRCGGYKAAGRPHGYRPEPVVLPGEIKNIEVTASFVASPTPKFVRARRFVRDLLVRALGSRRGR